MKNVMPATLKSPLLHFVVMGVAAYFLYTGLRPSGLETIHVTTQTIDALVQQQESITQNPLTEEEKQPLIAGHIEDEILLREAYKRGFEKNDFRVRQRILYIMRSSLSEVVPEPSVAQLRAFYQENRARYQFPPSRSFEHVYISFASTEKPENPAQFIQRLQRTADLSNMGELPITGRNLRKSSFESTARIFGKPFTERVFELPTGEWTGPIESFQGFHYVRVIATHDPELPLFEPMESYLREDYLLQKMRESQQRKIDDMGKNYKIIVDGAAEE